ncbi:MAG: hypothetical protein M3Q89_13785 [Verrucomicrobiota bacterium]|nr:hypothetical protein [Verrucomicrobiota bacterium]
MKRYTPSLESSGRNGTGGNGSTNGGRARSAGRRPGPETPPNSEPRLPHPPQSLDDLFYILISAQNCRGVEGRVQTFIRGLAARGRIVVLGGHVRPFSTAGNPFAREFLAELLEKNG